MSWVSATLEISNNVLLLRLETLWTFDWKVAKIVMLRQFRTLTMFWCQKAFQKWIFLGSTVYEEHCSGSGYKKHCSQVPKQSCKQVPKEVIVIQNIFTKCRKNHHDDSDQVHKSNPVRQCDQVPKERCHQVPQQVQVFLSSWSSSPPINQPRAKWEMTKSL